MQTAAAEDLDARSGAAWLAALGAAERLQILEALVRRFNHDLRTPLNNIVGWNQLLRKSGVDPARVDHAAEVIARNAREQTQLLAAFVEDCQIVIGSLKPEPDPVDVDTLIAEAVEHAGADRASADAPSTVRRLLDRLLLVCKRRAREGEAVGFRLSKDTGWSRVMFSVRARDAEWSAADLLELRLAALTASLVGGSLELATDSLLTTISLQLPQKTAI